MYHFDRLPPINIVRSQELSEILSELSRQEFRVFVLEGARIVSGATLASEINRVLPLAPPLFGPTMHWDAFADSLFGGLDELGAPRVGIVWTSAENLRDRSPPQFNGALNTFAIVASQLADAKTNIRTVVKLLVFVVYGRAEFRVTSAGQDVLISLASPAR